MSLTLAQVEQLLKPINPLRVLRDGKGHSHVSQQDVLAHLIRMFGFCNFDIDVLHIELVFEEGSERKKKAGGTYFGWDTCYRALVRLTIRDPDGNELCHYENGSTGSAVGQPVRGDAHDLAYKSAISLSIKRAAIALGDQAGLALYNKGQTSALVMKTLVMPGISTPNPSDMQEGVSKQIALGNDETDRQAVADV